MPFGKGHLGKLAFCFRTPHFLSVILPRLLQKFATVCDFFVQTFRFTGENRNGYFVVEKNFEV